MSEVKLKSPEIKTMILHNIISPYKTLLFNSIDDLCKETLTVYIAESAGIREWMIDEHELEHNYEILFKGNIDAISTFRKVRATLGALNSHKPKVLIIAGWGDPVYWAALLWAKSKKRKTIVWSASTEIDRQRHWLKEKFKSQIVKRFDAAHVYGIRSKEYLVTLGMKADDIFIVGTNADNSFFSEGAELGRSHSVDIKRELGLKGRVLTYVGRLSPEKNIVRLVDCFKVCSDNSQSTWSLMIVGNGPDRERITEYIERNRINNIVFTSFVQNKELPMYYGISDAFVLPSISEPWGFVVNEAMASGLPVLVSTQCGCYPDLLIEGKNGYSFDALDKAETIESLNRIMTASNEELKNMGEQSKRVIAQYSPEKAARIIIETVNSLLTTSID